MKIDKLEIKGFGKLSNTSLKLGEHLNVVFGSNESGKSTLQTFIKGMLYGLSGGRAAKDGTPSPIKRYKPWQAVDYGGIIEYRTDNGDFYRVVRDFNNNSVKVYDIHFNDITSTFEPGKDKNPGFAEIHTGLNEECFEGTVFMQQMHLKTGDDRTCELHNKLVNLYQAGMEDVSYIKAQQALNDALVNYVGTAKSSKRPIDIVIQRLDELQSIKEELIQKKQRVDAIATKLNNSCKAMDKFTSKRRILETGLKYAEAGNIYNELQKKKQSMLQLCNHILNEETRLAEIKKQIGSYDEQVLLDENMELLMNINYSKQEIDKLESNLDQFKVFDNLDPDINLKQAPGKHLLNAGIGILILVLAAIGGGLSTHIFTFKPPTAVFMGFVTALLAILIAIRFIKFPKYGSNYTGKNLKNIFQMVGAESADDFIKLRANYENSKSNIITQKDKLLKLERQYLDSTQTISSMKYLKQRKTDSALYLDQLKNEASDMCGCCIESGDALGKKALALDMEVEICKRSLSESEYKLETAVESLQTEVFPDFINFPQIRSDYSGSSRLIRQEIDEVEKSISLEALNIKEYETILKEYEENGDMLQKTEEEMEYLVQRKATLEETGLSLRTAINVLSQCSTEIRHSFAPALNSSMSVIVSSLTGGRYGDLRADDSLKLKAVSPETGDALITGLLSGGTTDQLYISMRLALADIISKSGEKLPVIMDEVFSQFDDTRLKYALNYLETFSQNHQVILFTCKQNEVDMVKEIFGRDMNLMNMNNL